jgi:hypothetical protein
MRFVLRPDYPVPADASLGIVNVTYALKTYGVYLVDQGADFEMDADFTHPDLWQEAGLGFKSLDVQPSDLRPAQLGTPPPIPTIVSPVTESRRASLVRLRANRLPIRVGSRLHLSGRVRGELVGYERVGIEVWKRGAWRYLLGGGVARDGRFAVGTRLLERPVRGSTAGRRRAGLLLRHVHVRAGSGLRLRAIVRGFGRSNVVRARLGR